MASDHAMSEPKHDETSAATRQDPALAGFALRMGGGRLAILIGAYALFDFAAAPPLLNNNAELVTSILYGAFAMSAALGQFSFLAVWGAIGPQQWIVRMSLVLGIAALLSGTFLAGVVVDGGDDFDFQDAWRVMAGVPLAFLLVQLPLFFLKVALGFQVQFRGVPLDDPSQARQFSMAHLLAGTVAAAVALGLAQLAFAGDQPGQLQPRQEAQMEMIVLYAGLFAWGLLGVLPTVWAALVAKSAGKGLLAFSAFAAAPVALLAVFSGGGGVDAVSTMPILGVAVTFYGAADQ